MVQPQNGVAGMEHQMLEKVFIIIMVTTFLTPCFGKMLNQMFKSVNSHKNNLDMHVLR